MRERMWWDKTVDGITEVWYFVREATPYLILVIAVGLGIALADKIDDLEEQVDCLEQQVVAPDGVTIFCDGR